MPCSVPSILPLFDAESMDNGWRSHNYHCSGLQIALRDDDCEETEVWNVLDNRRGRDDHDNSRSPYDEDKPKALILKNRASDIKLIPRPQPGSGTSRVQKSAPVNISYWPKKSNAGGPSSSSGKTKGPQDDSEDDDDEKGESDEEEAGEEGECSDSRLPPHEFIARRLARNHISSFSVFEGVGRTLKGRDLSKVRHAVLTKTGFLRSP